MRPVLLLIHKFACPPYCCH